MLLDMGSDWGLFLKYLGINTKSWKYQTTKDGIGMVNSAIVPTSPRGSNN